MSVRCERECNLIAASAAEALRLGGRKARKVDCLPNVYMRG